MSNIQSGTRGLSAGDWIRLKRLQGARPPLYSKNIIISAPPTDPATRVAFVLACIDPRFSSALEAFLAEQLTQAGFFSYDLFVLGGAALGGNLTGRGTATGECTILSTGSNWQTTLLDHIQVAITLHNVQDFYVIDHLLCGAYSNCILSGADDISPIPHQTQYENLKTLVQSTLFVQNGGSTKNTLGNIIFPNLAWNGLYFDAPVMSQTTLRNYLGVSRDTQIYPNTDTSKILVLGCIDPRFNALLTSFLVNYKDVQFDYNLFILAGSSLGVNQSYNTDGTLRAQGATGNAYPNNALALNPGRSGIGPLGHTWGTTFFDHLTVSRFLHNISEVWAFDHLDCGAYKFIKLNSGGSLSPLPSDNEIAPHTEELDKLLRKINQYTSTTDHLGNPPTQLAFKGFVIDTEGVVTKVIDDGRGVSVDIVKPPGSSRIRSPASEYTDSVGFNRADFITQRHSGSCNTQLTSTRLCECYPSPVVTKTGNCARCKNGNIA
jgi:hypothetical protein